MNQSQRNLVELQLEPGTKFSQRDLLVTDLLVGVVSEADEVVLIGKGDDPL